MSTVDVRKYTFSQQTINVWNRLPGECVNATSVNMFKNKIDNYFKRSVCLEPVEVYALSADRDLRTQRR